MNSTSNDNLNSLTWCKLSAIVHSYIMVSKPSLNILSSKWISYHSHLVLWV